MRGSRTSRRWASGACALLLALSAACSSVVAGAGTGSPRSVPGTSIPSIPSIPSATSSVPFLNELPELAAIPGVTFRPEPDRNHRIATISYDARPPVGGNHSPVWADCAGTVYSAAIADENAVHSLEHGAVWITYNPQLPPDQVAALAAQVRGVDRMLMSPYAGLRPMVSLQKWGYQLFLDSASDLRAALFISLLRDSADATPEAGATCSNPAFIAAPSTPGHPL